MILKDLNLISFGKFQDKELTFTEGINIIYGENESGKTTIHSFIEGMFYGFLKPYTTRHLYTGELDKYRPWNSQQYMGILKFSKGQREYMLERDFARGQVRVYDDLTGQDMMDEIHRGEKIRVNLPGLYFFGFNSPLYRNTISISQLGNRVEGQLAKELKDKLANIGGSMDGEISVKDCIADLDKELEEIGTARAYTKPYGQSLVDLKKLEEKRKLALEKQKDYNKTLEAFNLLKGEMKSKEDELNQLRVQVERTKIIEKKRTYDKLIKLKEDIYLLDNEIANLQPYSSLSVEDYEKGLIYRSRINSLDEGIMDLASQISQLKEAGGVEAISPSGQKNGLDHIRKEIDLVNERLKRTRKKTTISLILLIAGLALAFFRPILGVIAFPFIVLNIIFRRSANGLFDELDGLRKRMEEIKSEEILRDYKLEEIAIREAQLEDKKLDRQEIRQDLEKALRANKFNSLAEFKRGLDKKVHLNRLLVARDGKIQLMDGLLGNNSLEGIKSQVGDYQDEYSSTAELDILDVNNGIRVIEEFLGNMRDRYSKMEERLYGLNQEVKVLVHIEEEILRIKERISSFENRIESIEIAKATIEKISKEIHSQFAPRMNRLVGRLINTISDKYQGVKVDDGLNIALENPLTQEIIDIDSLSGGTIDQLYFALRYSIIDSIKGHKLPLILDDCFIQYDDARLTNTLKFLADISGEKQILLFTCHRREQEIMDRLNIDYNILHLS